MSLGLFMDVHVPSAVTVQSRLRGVDVLTAQEDKAGELLDPDLLDRASELGRILFTQDADLLTEASFRQRSGRRFVGVIYARQIGVTIGKSVADLELLAKATEPAEWVNRVEYLPLT
jgi:predicted nuclease of predicted toxin-antitoxin system